MASESFFDAQARIYARIKEAPHLQDIAAKKLLEVAAELEKTDEPAAGIVSKSKSEPFQVDFNNPFADLKLAFQKFRNDKWLKEPERYEPLKKGQWPKFMIITCVDSRVAPATILGLEPGEAFVLRNVANLVPPYEKGGYPSAGCAIEYAVKHLKVEHLLINGHHSCGGIGNLLHTQGGKTNCNHLFVETWTNIAAPAFEKLEAELKDASAEEKLRFAEKAAVNVSLGNLLTYPFVTEAVEAGKLKLHGSFYDLVNGKFEHWDFVDGKAGATQSL
eukprot:TRINITY_DN868_c0_g1_i1.p2 TRINITY_DN868_c0_g1~~TRINITY_DN868_c0_g1_i1.p2  ORF type:complete len:275 (-),score=56.85 TRINITY_DN868_c0_g1_i1:343-1167(-)